MHGGKRKIYNGFLQQPLVVDGFYMKYQSTDDEKNLSVTMTNNKTSVTNDGLVHVNSVLQKEILANESISGNCVCDRNEEIILSEFEEATAFDPTLCKDKQICDDIEANIYDNNGNITFKKKKKTVDSKSDLLDIRNTQNNHSRVKSKKEPLPMKLRALPRSFWQQPNNTASQSPGTVCPALALPCKEEVEDCLQVGPREAASEQAEPPRCHEEVVSDANTDLLFSLFRVIEDQHRRSSGRCAAAARRGRPKKAAARSALKDDDPCLVSAATESLLPLLPAAAVGPAPLRLPQKPRPAPQRAPAASSSYTRLLSEVVIRL